MKLRSEKGFTGIEIAVSVVIIFIFVSIIAILNYRISSTAKEIRCNIFSDKRDRKR